MATKATAAKARREVDAAERAHQALELRKSGLSYLDVGKAIGRSESQAWKIVQAALRELPRENAEELRALESARLDELTRLSTIGTKLGDPQAISAAVRVSERRSKLLGLDAPSKHELSGEVATGDFEAFRARLVASLCECCRAKVLGEEGIA